MNSFYIWLIIAVALCALEALTPQLTSVWFAIAAALAGVAAAFHAPGWLQIAIFAAASAVLVILTRPLAKRFLKPEIKTNVDALIGEAGVVTEAIDNIAAAGLVKVKGQLWTARSENGEPIASGELVTVVRVDGVKAIVEKQSKGA